MAQVDRVVQAAPEQVWSVLSDGWLYALWVVGAAHIRGVDQEWPAAQSAIHHAVGGWPVMIKDKTVVQESAPPRRLALLARAWPAGEARVELDLTPEGSGTRVVMTEFPVNGPARWLHNPLSEQVLVRRNVESLARLASLVEGRIRTGN